MVKSKKRLSKILGIFLLCLSMVFMSSMVAFADTPAVVDDPEAQMNTLSNSVYNQFTTDDKYKKEGGGVYEGQSIFTGWDYQKGAPASGSGTVGYTIDEKKFNELTSAAQSAFVSDVAKKSYDVVDASDTLSEDTVENWWKELQTKDGVGSKFLNVVLENTKPDFVSANRIYKPFSGLVGTVMGLIAVLGMGLLGIVLVADIFYIVIPPVRMLVAEGDGGKDGKLPLTKVFSNDAIYAVKVAEENSDAGGSKKQALGVYLGRRVPMLILLGICLLYLVQGQIYTLVGWILDLVSGFLGF